MALYDYQEDCVYHLLNSNLPRECVGLATSGGKTKIFTHYAALELARGNGVVIAVNRIELLKQAYDELKTSFNYSARLIQAGYKVEASEEPHIYIGMVETLSRRPELLRKLKSRCKVLIVDECFPAGTLVDGVPIENIKLNDYVTAFDEVNGSFSKKKVIAKSIKTVNKIIHFRLSNGKNLTCTTNHPIWDGEKWKKADLFKQGDNMVSTLSNSEKYARKKQLCPLRSRVRKEKSDTLVLQQKMFCQNQSRKSNGENSTEGGSQGKSSVLDLRKRIYCIKAKKNLFLSMRQEPSRYSCLKEDEKKQSNEFRKNKNQSFRKVETYEAQANDSRGKWKTSANSSANNECGVRMGSRTRSFNWLQPKKRKGSISDKLQARYSSPVFKNWNRNRWSLSLRFKKAARRQKERETFEIVRVENIEIYERGCHAEFDRLCPEGKVYNLEIEDLHTYTANKIIVHNCHYLQFVKILDDFERVIGFSATPQTMSKKIALSDYYQELYQAADITDLIDKKFLVKPLTYAPSSLVFKDIEKSLKVTGGDYEAESMGQILMEEEIFSGVFEAIEKYKRGRTIIYNASINHSKAVHEALLSKGYESYHVDGTSAASERECILERLKNSPEAIVNNVNVLTFGFNEPLVETIVINRLTKSENNFIQMVGRGARLAPSINKKDFLLLDLYGNCVRHGLWEDDRDWDSKFKNKATGNGGEAPVKVCPKCSAAIPIQAMECPVCGHVFEKEEVEANKIEDELALVDRSLLHAKVVQIAEQVQLRGQKLYAGLFRLVNYVYDNRKGKSESTIELELMIGLQKWVEEVRAAGHKKRFDDWHKNFVKERYDERIRNANLKA